MYFKYHHFADESFTINTLKDYGNYRIFVTVYDPQKDIYSQFPNSNNYQWTNMYIATAYTKDSIRILKNREGYCTKCEYLIGILAVGGQRLKGSLLVKVDKEYLFL